jgi:hypothetical protein
MVIVGLATGDVAVSPFQIDADFDDTLGLDARDADKGETPVLERDDEGEEVGLANNGTRTVTEGAVKFQRIGGRWLVDSIDCR